MAGDLVEQVPRSDGESTLGVSSLVALGAAFISSDEEVSVVFELSTPHAMRARMGVRHKASCFITVIPS